MKKDLQDLKKIVVELIGNDNQEEQDFHPKNASLIKKLFHEVDSTEATIQLGFSDATKSHDSAEDQPEIIKTGFRSNVKKDNSADDVETEENLSLHEIEEDMIKKSINKTQRETQKCC